MKTKLFILIFLCSLGTYVQGQSSGNVRGCGSCNDSRNDITSLGDNQFRARTAQAYYWEVCDGNATIAGSNTTRTITVIGATGSSGTIKLTRFVNGSCIVSCEPFTLTGGGSGSGDCPEATCYRIINVGEACTDIEFQMNCPDLDIDYIEWFYTISGQYVHDPVPGPGGNRSYGDTNGRHAINFSLPTPNTPSGTWDNVNLYLHANVVFDNGFECDEETIQLTLSCELGDIQIGDAFTGGIYPNPYTIGEKLSIKSNNRIENVTLYDLQGTLIKKYTLNNNSFRVEDSLKRGVYFLKYVENNVEITEQLLVKK